MANKLLRSDEIAKLLPDALAELSNKEIFDTVVATIASVLEGCDDVYLNGIGRLNVIDRDPVDRAGRNPKTGEAIRIVKPARLGLTLNVSRGLKAKLEAMPVTEAWAIKGKSVKAAVEAGTTDAEAVTQAIDTQAQPAPEALAQDPNLTQNDGA